MNLKINMTEEINDCSICSILNIATALGLEISRDEIKKVTNFNSRYGGSYDLGMSYLAKKFNLKLIKYPHSKDLIWINVSEEDKYRRRALPEKNKYKLFKDFIKLLKEGWMSVTQIQWKNTNSDHAIALIGIKNNKILVACSILGFYTIGNELFWRNSGGLQAAVGTTWVRK